MKTVVAVIALSLLSVVGAYAQDSGCTTKSCQDGYKAGSGITSAIIAGVETRHLREFCKKNPGQNYRGTPCLTDDEKAIEAMRLFIIRTPKFHQSPENAEILGTYIDQQRLDRTIEKSYEKAWKALYKTGQLELNK